MTYTVVYRTGDPADCKWHQCLPVADRPEANAHRGALELAGIKALVKTTAEVASIGLPEGWVYGSV